MIKGRAKGFSLFEMLLVLAISSGLVILLLNFTTRQTEDLRRTKTAWMFMQMQNAVLSYYINNGRWPIECRNEAGNTIYASDWFNFMGNYLPGYPSQNPYQRGQIFYTDAQCRVFYMLMSVNTVTNARIISAKVPGAFMVNRVDDSSATPPPYPVPSTTVCGTTGDLSACEHVVAPVNIPTQNLNNARSVNFAGVYHSGACVPAPTCPTGMTPQIFVTPASVSGVNDRPTGCTDNSLDNPQCNVNVYPVSSFAAFARGTNADGEPGARNTIWDCTITTTPRVLDCNYPNTGDTTLGANPSTYPALPAAQRYWRVCLAVITQRGQVVPTSTDSYSGGNASAYQQGILMGSILAITRCAPGSATAVTEPTGSDFRVWSPNSSWVP